MRITLTKDTLIAPGIRETSTLSRFTSIYSEEEHCLSLARERAKFLAATETNVRTNYCIKAVDKYGNVTIECYPR